MTPPTDQFRPVHSSSNVTYVCNITRTREVIWEVQGVQLGSAHYRAAAQDHGIFVEQVEPGVSKLIVTRYARLQHLDSGVTVRCLSFNPAAVQSTELIEYGPLLLVGTYGKIIIPFL